VSIGSQSPKRALYHSSSDDQKIGLPSGNRLHYAIEKDGILDYLEFRLHTSVPAVNAKGVSRAVDEVRMGPISDRAGKSRVAPRNGMHNP